MKYVDYLRNAAAQAVQFGGDCANLAGDVIANIPEQAAAVSSAVATYTETAGAAISAFVERESVETFNGVVSASSALASTLGDALENSPSYLESFAGMVADYTTAAAAAASAYLAGKEPTDSMQWVQIQDDGAYVQGYGGTSGGAGSSGEWDKITPPPKYPEAGKIPIVPPEAIPTGEPKIRKVKPITPTPAGCLGLQIPQPGAFARLEFDYWAQPLSCFFWDNIYYRTLSPTHADTSLDALMNSDRAVGWYAGSPVAIPSSSAAQVLANLPRGRYAMTLLGTGERIFPGVWPEFYTQKEGWAYEIRQDGVASNESFTDDWFECLPVSLNYGGPGMGNWMFKYMPYMLSARKTYEGEGHAMCYTVSRYQIHALGDDFEPVEETPEETPTPAAYLATLGAIEALSFHNIFNILRGARWGR